jgi:lipoic acid synthetase
MTATDGKSHPRLPDWLDKRLRWEDTVEVKRILRDGKIHTICEEARCPNMAECFKRRTATFLLLGDHCTRGCAFCNVAHAAPRPPDEGEAEQIAEAAELLALRYAVLTSVTRDDLPDGGAAHFARVVRTLKLRRPGTRVEVLTPDFGGDPAGVRTVLDARPDVFGHNLETVRSLTPKVRSHASYERSLEVLRTAAADGRGAVVKSGIMVGLGETGAEVREALADLRAAGCEVVTVGQYLRPNRACLPVMRYVEPAVFDEYRAHAEGLGFRKVFAGPYVRSSYLADELFAE